MKILTIIGARPQFIKAAMFSHAIGKRNSSRVKEVILYTGQHYDTEMSSVFFDQMGIPPPSYSLSHGGKTHGEMTGAMMIDIENISINEKPDIMLVYGDTNSTLAGALVASKLHIPLVHAEAGLRSYNKKIPEETNRILIDRVSSWLFCPTRTAVENLKKENITQGVYHTGDIMYDAALCFSRIVKDKSTIVSKLGLTLKLFFLATLHRAENTDSKEILSILLSSFELLSERSPAVLPLHPRTREKIKLFGLNSLLEKLLVIPPVSFLDMIALESRASLILTDSGGGQKEAYFYRVPCITLREETEWIETVQAGWNQLCPPDLDTILDSAQNATLGLSIEDFGDGTCAERILNYLIAESV